MNAALSLESCDPDLVAVEARRANRREPMPHASKGFCRVDIHRVLVQSNLLRVIEPETTTGRTTRAYLWKTAALRYP